MELASGRVDLRVAPHSGEAFAVDALVGRFMDSSSAYRFGPCPHAVALAELTCESGAPPRVAHHLPGGLAHEVREDVGLRAEARARPGGYRLRVETRELALFVRISAAGLLPSDNYFHLAPREAREIDLAGAAAQPRIHVGAVNSRTEATA
jgi:beta-mannosidase